MNETIEEAASRLSITTEELLAEAAIIRYSTTLAMNRLIERKGPKLGLLITEGFEDTTLIGRASQWADGVPLKYQRNIAGVDRPEPLIPKELIVGVASAWTLVGRWCAHWTSVTCSTDPVPG